MSSNHVFLGVGSSSRPLPVLTMPAKMISGIDRRMKEILTQLDAIFGRRLPLTELENVVRSIAAELKCEIPPEGEYERYLQWFRDDWAKYKSFGCCRTRQADGHLTPSHPKGLVATFHLLLSKLPKNRASAPSAQQTPNPGNLDNSMSIVRADNANLLSRNVAAAHVPEARACKRRSKGIWIKRV